LSAPSDPSVREPGPARPIATRARLYLVGAAFAALVVAFGVFAVGWSLYVVQQRTDTLARQVSALAKGQAVATQSEATSTAASARLFQVEAGLIGAALFVTDESGRVEQSTLSAPQSSLPIEKLSRRSAVGTTSGILRNASGVRVLVVMAPIDSTHRLVAVQGLAEIRAAYAGMLVVAAIALAVAAVVAYVAGGMLARRLSAPLTRLRDAAEQVAAGGFGAQVAEEGDAETTSLARSFNRMSTRVADAYSAQEAFVGDVSHEIRTPLTSIRGFAEAMLDGTVSDAAQQSHALHVIYDEAGRIGEVTDALLTLSSLDAGAVALAAEPVDVDALADALRARFAHTAETAGVALEFALAGEPLADPSRVLQSLSALVANAIAHAPSGGRVRVSSRAEGTRWEGRVEDSGPGIPFERRQDVFGRFTRLDSSRSAEGGGAGLGLAICKRLVELMGGAIDVEDSELGGALFVVRLPSAT
jgi:signal transduction histidine kinase